MSLRAAIENRATPSEMPQPDATDGRSSTDASESWRRRAKRAEDKATALEAENQQLRSERTTAVLAAARAEKAAKEAQPPAAEAPKQQLDALTTGMKIAEEAVRGAEAAREAAIREVRESLRDEYAQRVEAMRRCHAAALAANFEQAEAQARQAVTDEIESLRKDLDEARAALAMRDGDANAIRAVEDSLRKDFARRIDAIRRGHAAELTARCEEAESRARQDVGAQINRLATELKDAREAVRVADGEREGAVRRVEESLKAEFCAQYEAIGARHAAELAAQLSAAKKRFAEELMASLAAAHAAWQAETEKKLRQAERDAQKALARSDAAGQRRSRAAVWNAAMVWRARERQRMNAARQKWDAAHRSALEACNRRWRAKLDRLKKTARRSPWQSSWQWTAWPQAKQRIGASARSWARRCLDQGQAACRLLAPRRAAIAHTLCVVAVLTFAAIRFSPMGSLPLAGPGEGAAVAAAETARPQQIARLPRGQTGDRAKVQMRVLGSTVRENPAIGSQGTRPGDALTDAALRLRLEARIQKLREELSPK